MRIAFDVHGTLDNDPDLKLLDLMYSLVALHEVFIISGPPKIEILENLENLGINHTDITIISVVDYLKSKKTYMWMAEDESWWCDDKLWWSSKGRICHEYGIDIIFDDKVEYARHIFSPTEFILWRGR